ncbi:fad-binding type 2 protein [Gracilaria domingensis]|nr:fad-binding type 2 protein [Gracilaria domingensis]KAI0556602.1 fad-binding type 2 protein [Gracilaria domingensis]KAI0558021.1 fad-binding type 2 protein [Gracilaria domingensis]
MPTQKDFRTDFSESQLRKAERDFERDANKFYSEWFWFPFQDECWLNSWNVTAVGDERPVYPDAKEVENQNLQSSISRLFEVTLLKFLPDKVQARLFGTAAMFFLPTGSLSTSVSNALHFRRGIHRIPVRDTKVSIEIPGTKDGKQDFSICRKAWWHAISEVYESLEERGEVPMRTAVEMRIVGGSDTLMSTQRGNVHGTCAIEVLTNTLVEEEEWKAFVDRVVARWETLKNPLTGEALKLRPHWAKEWPRKMGGQDVINFLQRAYGEAAPKFLKQMQLAAADGGYELTEAFGIFGNDTMLNIIQG